MTEENKAQYDIASKVLGIAREEYITLNYTEKMIKKLNQVEFDCLSLYVSHITQKKVIIDDTLDYRDSACHIEFLSPKAKLSGVSK